jgi:hypothetical protein
MKPTPEDAKRVFDYAYATATGCGCWPVSEQMACRECRMRPVCITVRDAIADAPKPPCPDCGGYGYVRCPWYSEEKESRGGGGCTIPSDVVIPDCQDGCTIPCDCGAKGVKP